MTLSSTLAVVGGLLLGMSLLCRLISWRAGSPSLRRISSVVLVLSAGMLAVSCLLTDRPFGAWAFVVTAIAGGVAAVYER